MGRKRKDYNYNYDYHYNYNYNNNYDYNHSSSSDSNGFGCFLGILSFIVLVNFSWEVELFTYLFFLLIGIIAIFLCFYILSKLCHILGRLCLYILDKFLQNDKTQPNYNKDLYSSWQKIKEQKYNEKSQTTNNAKSNIQKEIFLLKIDRLKNAPNLSSDDIELLLQLENLLKSEHYSGNLDALVTQITDELLEKMHIVNLTALLNTLSDKSKINYSPIKNQR